jgi:hypothetical protein
MANQSTQTRKEQVLAYLTQHANRWVNGPELANESVGGSEGLKRVRELRAEGKRIVQRPHPDPERDIWQYKLVVEEATPARTAPPPPPDHFGMHYDEASGRYQSTVHTLTCIDCRAEYRTWAEHIQSEPHLRWAREKQARDANSVKLDQGPQFSYRTKPAKLTFGEAAQCPRCHGVFKTIPRKNSDPPLMPWEQRPRFDYCSDPDDVYKVCIRCNGFGIVPNIGPIPGGGTSSEP